MQNERGRFDIRLKSALTSRTGTTRTEGGPRKKATSRDESIRRGSKRGRGGRSRVTDERRRDR